MFAGADDRAHHSAVVRAGVLLRLQEDLQ